MRHENVNMPGFKNPKDINRPRNAKDLLIRAKHRLIYKGWKQAPKNKRDGLTILDAMYENEAGFEVRDALRVFELANDLHECANGKNPTCSFNDREGQTETNVLAAFDKAIQFEAK